MRRDKPLTGRENRRSGDRRDRGPGLGRLLWDVAALYMHRYQDADLDPKWIREVAEEVIDAVREMAGPSGPLSEVELGEGLEGEDIE